MSETFFVNIVSIFPEFFDGPIGVSLPGRALESGRLSMKVYDPRDFLAPGERVDDYPFGGGPGMVMKAEPVIAAVESISPERRGAVLVMSASGERFTQRRAEELAQGAGITLVCGRYEGIDQRAIEHLRALEVSVADCVLAGGEAAALVVLESVVRLLPGVMGNVESAREESYVMGLLEYPQYTRPRVVRGLEVPEVLLSGDHAAVARWRRGQAIVRTAARRPDLIAQAVKSGLVSEEELEELGISLSLPPQIAAEWGQR